MNAVARELARGRWPDKEQVADGQRPDDIFVVLPRNDRRRVGLFHVRAELGKNFVVADPDADRHAQFKLDALAQSVRHSFSVAKQFLAARQVQPALVEAEALNSVGVVSVDFAGKAGEV